MKARSRNRRPRKAGTPAPARVLRVLEAAAAAEITIARYVLDLFDTLLGTQSDVFPRHPLRFSPGNDLPAPVGNAARKLITWSLDRDRRFNEVLASRLYVLGVITAMRCNSPYGKRCLEAVRTIRARYEANAKVALSHPGAATANSVVSVLDNAVGLPLCELTMRQVEALRPAEIRIIALGESFASTSAVGTVTIWLGKDGFTVTEIWWAVHIPPASAKDKIEGVLLDYFETGTEGVLWTVLDDENVGREGLHVLEPGDRLTVFDPLGHELWSGVICCNYGSTADGVPAEPGNSQLTALGRRVHWVQKGFAADEWARLFVRPDVDRLRGILQKRRDKRG